MKEYVMFIVTNMRGVWHQMLCCKKCVTHQTQRLQLYSLVFIKWFCIKKNKGHKLTNTRCPGRSEKTEGIITGTLHEFETGNIMRKLPRDK